MPPTTLPRPADTSHLIPAIGYIRVSLLQEEQISPEIQRTAITEWAQRHGRHLIEWIEDLDVTGRTFRRQIMRGIEAIEAGRAKEIIVWKFSRFGRNRTGCAINLGRINKAGGELQSATETVDARTAVGKLTRGVLMEIAAFESDRAGEQWSEAHAHRRARGLPATGRNRFGYIRRGRQPDPLQPYRTVRDPDDGEERYEPDYEGGTAGILADLYRRYIAGEGGRALAVWLNEHGLYTTRGRHWSGKTLLGMLDAGFGAGKLRIHDPNCGCTNALRCPYWILVDGVHEPVIDEDTWQAYLRRRKRVKTTAPRARAAVYPLSGLVVCGHCGGTVTFAPDGPRKGYWLRCIRYIQQGVCAPRSVNRARAEQAVVDHLAKWASDIEAEARRHATQAPPPRPEPVRATARLKAQIAALDEQLVNLTRQLAAGRVPEDAYETARDGILQEKTELLKALEAAEQPRPRERVEYVPVMLGLAAEWHTLPAAERRELLAEVLDRVEVFRTDRKTAWLVIHTRFGESQRVDL